MVLQFCFKKELTPIRLTANSVLRAFLNFVVESLQDICSHI